MAKGVKKVQDVLTESGTEGNLRKVYIVAVLLPILAFLFSFPLGRFPIPVPVLLTALAGKVFPFVHGPQGVINTVIFEVRLPRIIAAMLVGAALSMAGVAYQGMFKNPLVSPDILGASAGAGFGAALAIYFSLNNLGIQVAAFAVSLLAVMSVYFLSSKIKRDPTLALVLTGILVATLCSSFTSLLKYVADPYDKLPAITFWLMGSLASVSPQSVISALCVMLLGGVPLYLLRWRLNVLSLSEEESKTLGLETGRLRLVVIICSSLLTAGSVAISGLIGWVGLIVPHLARMIVGPNYKVLLPVSIAIGSVYMLLVDDLARCLTSAEIPLGILTSIIGAPFFFSILLRGKKGW
ncbi:iron ABC transporter permease [Desulfosporosinus sp. PR]|uniref:FecCD family ABC transporter permease n=1 Tax=Candidatus Desulfosporosinus nitrosoreducens TaxID=3401928 RepID=UPI0027F42F96|nr:iron ABC transporter permease [Desulfosporosinus sp. PR]MDQ7094558.1 iron ABC transporter permease [Desulfosporosinus sp. PR]